MACKPDIIGRTGLAFFGAMSSSNFHEINNALAIINENGGLLGDLINMANDGKEIEIDKLCRVSSRIMNQVDRAKEIVKTINRFSHSVEHSKLRVDLGETVTFVAHLAHRFAHMTGVEIRTNLTTDPVKITTSPFFLENLVWLCLDFAMKVLGDEKIITIFVEYAGDRGLVRFSNLDRLTPEVFLAFKNKDELAILNALEAEIDMDQEKMEIFLSLPKRFSKNCLCSKI